jgi:undecaprenyl diphosphate synthase
VLTLYAFSQENWQRPPMEVTALMGLLELYVRREREELRQQGVQVRVIGELDRLPARTRKAIDNVIEHTREGTRLRLNLAISYGSRTEIVNAARRLAERVLQGTLVPGEIDEARFAQELYTADVPDPDLLIRTSGEMRISNFLLWQIAYTEVSVLPVLWPDFSREHLFNAILDFQRRERRFGRVLAS